MSTSRRDTDARGAGEGGRAVDVRPHRAPLRPAEPPALGGHGRALAPARGGPPRPRARPRACSTSARARPTSSSRRSRRDPRHSGLGVDLSHAMLVRGAAKLARGGYAGRAALAGGDGERLPVRDGLFDGALVAFGIRNVGDPVQAMREVRPGAAAGRALRGARVLDAGGPARGGLPLLLPARAAPARRARERGRARPTPTSRPPWRGSRRPRRSPRSCGRPGFVDVRWQRLTGGIACLHRGEKPR